MKSLTVTILKLEDPILTSVDSTKINQITSLCRRYSNFYQFQGKIYRVTRAFKRYRVVFNSQVNYSTSTACPSVGGYMFNKREFKELMVNNDLK